jgi:hypothetical protein
MTTANEPDDLPSAVGALRLEWETVESDEAMYQEMLDIAHRYGSEAEIERIATELDSCKWTREQIIEELTHLGLGPHDLEAQGDEGPTGGPSGPRARAPSQDEDSR